jgi:hypothetical protein
MSAGLVLLVVARLTRCSPLGGFDDGDGDTFIRDRHHTVKQVSDGATQG